MNSKQLKHDENLTIIDNILKSKCIRYELDDIKYSRNYTKYRLKISNIGDVKDLSDIENNIVMNTKSEKGVFMFEDSFDGHILNIEIPNKKIYALKLTDYLDELNDYLYSNIHDEMIYYILGENENKECIISFISDNILVGGDIDSGVNNFIKAMITSLVYKYNSKKLNLILIDHNNIGLNYFEKLPHILHNKVFNKNEDVFNVLDEIILTIKERIKNKTKACKKPKIVIFFNEYSNYMNEGTKKLFEEKICYIAKNSIESGIYLVLATQNISKETVTKRLKNTFTYKISFNMSSKENSRLFINYEGAVHLLQFGDMLTKKENDIILGAIRRYQAYTISDDEIKKLVDTINKK